MRPISAKSSPSPTAETWPPVVWDRAAIESNVKALSALFRTASHIANSEVRFNGNNILTRYINSEGTSFTRQSSMVQLVVVATTQAVDRMPLSHFDTSFGRAMSDLPSREEMTKRIGDLQARIGKLARRRWWIATTGRCCSRAKPRRN